MDTMDMSGGNMDMSGNMDMRRNTENDEVIGSVGNPPTKEGYRGGRRRR
jgi:hypothetical protein